MKKVEFDAKFKDVIYDPYTEAWGIIKELKSADLTTEEAWDSYFKKFKAFEKKYKDTEIGNSISRVILDAGTEIKRFTNGDYKIEC